MKRNVLLALVVLVTLLISGCPGVSGPGGEPGTSGNNDKYTREFLGEWIRMDTGERWYISGNSISVNGAAFNRTVALEKSSAQVVTVKEQGRPDYFLFASRVADAGFSARVVLIDGNETERTSISRAAIPSGGFKIKPPTNPGLEQTVYPNPETGEIIVDGVIPGDPVEISPEDPEWNNINVGLTPEDGQDMGIIPLAKGVNLKASIRMAGNGDITELYADDVPRGYIIEVENIGTVNCIGASYEISWNDEDFGLVSGSRRATLDTIVPGAKKQINLTLASKPIASGNKNKEIGVTIVNFDVGTGTILRWEDTVSVNYYKVSVPFRFRSEKPVQGVIRTPRNKTYYFKTSGQDGNCTYSVNLPWSNENYVVTFLGASVETNSETKYSLAIDGQPPSDWDSLWGEDMFRYETVNKSVNTAPVLDLTDNRSFMYYLYTGAVQYFRINLGGTPPEPGEGQNYFTVYFSSNGGSNVFAQTVEAGGSAFRPADPSRSGYVFDDWYSDPALTAVYDFSAPVTGNITLYAKWNSVSVGSYTVTFESNGGSGVAAQIVDSGGTASRPANPTRAGYTFVDWYGDSNLTGVYNFSTPVTGNITLYAKWNTGGTSGGLVEMVFVPGGSFEMGKELNPGSGYSDVTPVHTVTVTGFYMGRTEVTQAQYQAVMGSLPSSLPSSSYGVGDNYPVYYVSWYDALVFCNKLSIREGLTPAYRINNSTDPAAWGTVPTSSDTTWNAVIIVSGSTGYRLPTEAQWEYAAKGGDGSPGNYTYAGSNNADAVAWYWDNSGSTTHAVGTKAPNGLGLYDMSGNAEELCWDRSGSYSSGAQTDPTGASSGSDRVWRGGSRRSSAEDVRSASRRSYYPSLRTDSVGFRLVRP